MTPMSTHEARLWARETAGHAIGSDMPRPKLTRPQDEALARIAANGGTDLSGIRSATIGALVGAGYLKVWHREIEETFRPSRSWSNERWTRRRTVRAGVMVTDAGVAYLKGKAT